MSRLRSESWGSRWSSRRPSVAMPEAMSSWASSGVGGCEGSVGGGESDPDELTIV